MSTTVLDGIEYRRLDASYNPSTLYDFNVKHGSTPHNFIPEGPVREHLSKLKTGETVVWGAFDTVGDQQLVGMLTAEIGGGYWLQTGDGSEATCFVNEFVVAPSHRGRRIGVQLTALSVHPTLGIFGLRPEVTEMYTTVHSDNVTSRTAFVKGGYHEVLTYADAHRDRNTTVLKCGRAGVAPPAQRGNSRPMRVIGIQSGNAVDGIDVGVFEFAPLARSAADPRALAGSLTYTTLANKTFSFTPEQREFVLGLRALNRPDGNEYAIANYRLGEWMADNALVLLAEAGIDKASIDLIGSHGQTVSGHPHWELGDVSVIAQRTGITTAADFRPADVAAGGNGTPCTCTYDSIMLRPPAGATKWRVAINIGGTSSVTFLPPWPQPGDAAAAAQVPLGLDPGLGVFFMDLTTKCIDPTLEYDDDGAIARGGTTHDGLLAEFLTHPYYQKAQLPIGVGPDDFPETLFASWRGRAQELGLSDADLLSTLTELTAKQIALACARFGGPGVANGATDDVLLRGGVCHNSYFVERLRAQMSEQLGADVKRISTLADVGLDEDSWENAMYAMFGYLCYNNVYNFVPSCTGAARPVVGGRIAPGENFHSVKLQGVA